MTTIAYRLGVIATDSLVVCGNIIYDRWAEKKIDIGGAIFWLSGDYFESERFARKIVDGARLEDDGHDCSGAALINGKLYSCGYSEGKYWKCEMADGFWAWGSGAEIAMGAMEMNASAEQAVTIACKRDVFTGGGIRAYDAKTGDRLK